MIGLHGAPQRIPCFPRAGKTVRIRSSLPTGGDVPDEILFHVGTSLLAHNTVPMESRQAGERRSGQNSMPTSGRNSAAGNSDFPAAGNSDFPAAGNWHPPAAGIF